MGKLYFRYGVMGSSKSATLLTQNFAFEQAGFPVCVIKPATDTRDIGIVKSRINGLECECRIIMSNESILPVIIQELGVYMNDKTLPKWILVDECQFLTEEQVNELHEITYTYDVNIMCYGLRTDFQTKFFEGSRRLMEIADSIEELKFSCPFCGKKAIINARYDKTNDKVITEGEQVCIGGNETYVPMCGKCYKEKQ